MSLNSDANFSDIIADVKNIISSDTNEIHLSKSFVDEFALTNKALDVLSASMRFDSGMTEYECEHFVADPQLTPWRKVRQALMELETRYHAYMENRNSLRKAEILRKRLNRDMPTLPDELDRELMQIDMEKNDYDIGIWKRKLRQSELELKYFLNVVDKYVDDEHPLEYYCQENHQEVRMYWIARMGKQAAMDVYITGRIGLGNLDSIAMMREEDQYATLNIAMQYSGLLSAGIGKIQNELKPQLDKMMIDGSAPRIPTFDNVEDNLDLKLYEQLTGNEQKSIQSSDQPETE